MGSVNWLTSADVTSHPSTDGNAQSETASGILARATLVGDVFGSTITPWTYLNNGTATSTEASGTLTQSAVPTEDYDRNYYSLCPVPASTAFDIQIDFSGIVEDAAGAEVWFGMHNAGSGAGEDLMEIGLVNLLGTINARARKIDAGSLTNLATAVNSQTSGKFRIVSNAARSSVDFKYHDGSEWQNLVAGVDLSALGDTMYPCVVGSGGGLANLTVVWDNLVQNDGGVYWASGGTVQLVTKTLPPCKVIPGSCSISSTGTAKLAYSVDGGSYSSFMTPAAFIALAEFSVTSTLAFRLKFNDGGENTAASIDGIGISFRNVNLSQRSVLGLP